VEGHTTTLKWFDYCLLIYKELTEIKGFLNVVRSLKTAWSLREDKNTTLYLSY
jgi:hypothetical protein